MSDPSALTDISIRHLSDHLLPLVADGSIHIAELSCLSPRLGNLLLRTLIEMQKQDLAHSTDYFLSLFYRSGDKHNKKPEVLVQLSELHFRSCSFITNHSISNHLVYHELITTIDLRDCNVTYKILPLLTKHFPRLTTLHLGQTENRLDRNVELPDFFPRNYIHSKYFLIKPKLRTFTFEGIYQTAREDDSIREIIYQSLVQSSEQMRCLDLSRNSALDSLFHIECFQQMQTLVLYDILPKVIEASLDALCSLKTLVLLDLSYNRRTQDAPSYANPTLTLAKLTRSMPKLLSLDISGTNLGGNFSFNQNEELTFLRKVLSIDEQEVFTVRSSIAGLLVLQHELEFLGLFDTEERASARQYLPAKKVTGEHSEEMLMTSLSHYMERPGMLTHIMAHLFRLYNHFTIQNPFDAGKLVMDAMEKYVYDRSLQTSGSACLYYVVDMFQNESQMTIDKYSDYLKRLLVTIVRAMNTHYQHSPMIRNGLLTISRIQMHLPSYIMYAFKPTVDVLVKFIRLYVDEHVLHEPTLLHNALSVLNHVACSVDGQEKLYIGHAGAIETAMKIIQRFLLKNINCEIVEIAWTLLWNITDETPDNCQQFIEDSDGLQTFLDCLKTWSDKRDLVRNMLGLLGNVAEVTELRHYLVTPMLMESFRMLLRQSQHNDIEIPYNCAGVLANILSDGSDGWTIGSSIDMAVVNQEMFDSIQTWDLRRPRTINYRSLSPILRLLNENYPSGCIMWAVWAMTNLTTVLPEKYCTLVRNENGEPLLSQILYSEKLSQSIKSLAEAALANVQRFYDPPVAMEIAADDVLEI